MNLILIRHAQTDYNLQNRYCGLLDPPLNPTGIQQSQNIVRKINGLAVDRIYASCSQRAVQTAKIIFSGKPVKKMSDFSEMNFGIFEGLSYQEIIKKYHRLYQNWINDPLKIKLPQGESLNDLVKRVKKGLKFILSQNEAKTIALVSHAGPIKIILSQALKLTGNDFWEVKQDIAALSIIDYSLFCRPEVIKMNDVSNSA